MTNIGRPVVITGSEWAGHVGVVEDRMFGVTVVSVGGRLVGLKDSEFEPLYTTAEIAAVYVTEVDDETGEEFDPEETKLESMVKPFGYSSDDLANFCEEFMTKAVARVRGTGNEQYSQGNYQQFEQLDIDELFEYVNVELYDMMNYLAMLFIRLERLRRGFKLDMGDDIEPEDEETEDA